MVLQPGLRPEFSSEYSASQNGFSFKIINFDPEFTWACVSSLEKCDIDSDGKLTGSGFRAGSNVTIKVTTSRKNYTDEEFSITFTPKLVGLMPLVDFASIKSITNGAEFLISNFYPSWSWSGFSSIGDFSLDSAGKVVVSNLTNAAESKVTVTATKSGYFSQSYTLTVKPPPEFKNLFLRDWQFIVKDPDGNKDQYVVIFGKITQFDSGTGLSTFRADVAGQDIFSSGYGGDNSMLTGDLNILKPFVAGDRFTAKVKILATYSYTSAFSGKFTVPYLQIYEIKLM